VIMAQRSASEKALEIIDAYRSWQMSSTCISV